MATLGMELSSELSSLEVAIDQYAADPTLQACEMICIRSRMATATFEELACWTQCVHEELRSTLQGILTRAIEVLARDIKPTDVGHRYLQRIIQRRDRIRGFTLAMLEDCLPSS